MRTCTVVSTCVLTLFVVNLCLSTFITCPSVCLSIQIPMSYAGRGRVCSILVLDYSINLDDHIPFPDQVGILETFLIAFYSLGRSAARLDKDAEAEKALMKTEKIHAEFAKLPAAESVVVAEWQIKIVIAIARLFVKKKRLFCFHGVCAAPELWVYLMFSVSYI